MEMKSKFFLIEELVDPETLDVLGEESCWSLFDERLIATIDFIKSNFLKKTISINTWKWGGSRKYSGYRPKNCTIGAAKSKHKIGEAVDMLIDGLTGQEMRSFIIDNKDKLPYPIRIEANVSWLHIDTANDTESKIYIFKQ